MPTERQTGILEAVVREFIRKGEPVSSGFLFRRHRFGIRPAMIRAELSMLTDEGYLAQPYHSAGRVPTNRGYEFFASKILEKEIHNRALNESLSRLFHKRRWNEFAGLLSRQLGILSVVGCEEGEVYKGGLEQFLRRLNWDSREHLFRVMRDVEAIDEHMRDIHGILEEECFPEVFIGRKSPYIRSDELAIVAGRYPASSEMSEVFLLTIGPKRMDYEKTVGVFRGLRRHVVENVK